jgi:UDP-N-acetylmuramoyl-L-alanyl-D-glutamate--2,6-diaminopimelate ligase
MNYLKKLGRKIFSQETINKYHLAMAVLANIVYRFPAKELRVIGVTGTNGKTTTCHMITSVLQGAGRKVGMTTTINFQIADQKFENNLKMTTVSPFMLQRFLRKMVNAGCEDAVIEVTSIALEQHRLWGIPFHTVVFTNLTHDHLDYHKTMTEYRQAKEKLFANNPTLSIVNADDPVASEFLKYPAQLHLTYGLNGQPPVAAKKVYAKPGGTDFVVVVGQRQAALNLPLPGIFNVYNALAAATVGIGLAIDIDDIVAGLRTIEPVPGRMEVIDQGQAFTVIVDYAHTPDALQKVYETVKPTVRGKLISVLGATGRRDKTKRPFLGALAGKYADYIFVTNEDPYDEDPMTIIKEVAVGIPKGRPKKGRMKINKESEINIKYRDTGEDISWWKVLDRKEAIERALEMARPQDVVLVTGKGAEKVMAVGDKLVPFSDKEVLERALVKYQVK